MKRYWLADKSDNFEYYFVSFPVYKLSIVFDGQKWQPFIGATTLDLSWRYTNASAAEHPAFSRAQHSKFAAVLHFAIEALQSFIS